MELDRDLERERRIIVTVSGFTQAIIDDNVNRAVSEPENMMRGCDSLLEQYPNDSHRDYWQYLHRLAMQVIQKREQSADALNNHIGGSTI